MTAGLETFAKVRTLHDRTDNPGEKAAAAGRMEALARSAGMTVAEAVSKLDAAPVRSEAGFDWTAMWEAVRRAEAAGKAADEPDAWCWRRRGLPIYDPDKIEPWRTVAAHCLQIERLIPKAQGGKFLTKDERARLKAVAGYGHVTNATADWIETVLNRCHTIRAAWRDRSGLAGSGARPGRKMGESDVEWCARMVAATKEREASKMDSPQPQPPPRPQGPAQDAADSLNAFFNRPEMRAQRAEQDRARQERRAEILARYGSVEAVYAETEREVALRVACEPFTIWDRRPDRADDYTLDGWDWLQGREKVPVAVREAVAQGWPLPRTVKAVWAEYAAADAHEGERHVMHDYEHHPALWSEVRRYVLEDLLDTLPAASIGDMLARQSWMEHWSEIGARNGDDERRLLATLRADIERMGQRLREQDAGAARVQNGRQGSAQAADPSVSSCSATAQNRAEPAPVQNGHPEGSVSSTHPLRRSNADKRRDVLALLNQGLADREIARRAGVSPQTVGNIRKGQL